jgi:uncharacterized protein YndB with AHSA1/START domain
MSNTSELRFETVIEAPRGQVWQAWTTREGVLSFFAPNCRLEMEPGGAYEMYFNLDAPKGEWGGEGCRFLAIEEPCMLSFTWNAPPEFPDVRRQKTHVTLRFEEVSMERTRVILTHDGWGSGEEWQLARAYFERAWGQVVLPRLQKRFLDGPIHWDEME